MDEPALGLLLFQSDLLLEQRLLDSYNINTKKMHKATTLPLLQALRWGMLRKLLLWRNERSDRWICRGALGNSCVSSCIKGRGEGSRGLRCFCLNLWPVADSIPSTSTEDILFCTSADKMAFFWGGAHVCLHNGKHVMDRATKPTLCLVFAKSNARGSRAAMMLALHPFVDSLQLIKSVSSKWTRSDQGIRDVTCAWFFKNTLLTCSLGAGRAVGGGHTCGHVSLREHADLFCSASSSRRCSANKATKQAEGNYLMSRGWHDIKLIKFPLM